MTADDQSRELQGRIEELERQLEHATETLRAIQQGEVDALVVQKGDDVQVYTLETADRPYRAFLEGMQQGALTLDADGTVLYCNQCFCDMVHAAPEAVLGQPLQSFVASASTRYLEALLYSGRTVRSQGEIVLKTHGTDYIDTLVTVNPLRTDDKSTFCVLITDLTEQKRYQALVADQQLGQLILDQAIDAIVVCDDKGTIIRASQAAHRLCTENPLLQPFEKVLPLTPSRSSFDVASVSIREVLTGKIIQGLECSLPRAGKEHYELLVSAGPLRNAGQATIGCVVTLSDITKQKRVEAELYDKIQDLEKFSDAVVGRELKMIELEKQLERLTAFPKTKDMDED